MQFTVKCGEFRDALQLAARAVPERGFVPILRNVLIEGEYGALKITGTDLECGVVAPCPAQMTKAGRISVLAGKLLAYISGFGEDAELELISANAWTTVKSGSSRAKFASMDAGEFPVLPQPNGEHTIEIPGKTLAAMIRNTAYILEMGASADAQVKSYQKFLLAEFSGAELKIIATDGKRMLIAGCNGIGPKEKQALLISKEAAALAERVCGSAESVLLSWNDNHIFLDAGTVLTVRRSSFTFPNIQNVAQGKFPNSLTIQRSDLEPALSRLSAASDKDTKTVAMRLRIDNGRMILSRMIQEVVTNETLEIRGGANASITFNCDFIREFARHSGGDEIQMSYSDDRSTVRLTASEDPDLFFYGMPMRQDDRSFEEIA